MKGNYRAALVAGGYSVVKELVSGESNSVSGGSGGFFHGVLAARCLFEA
jgi:hypothetical protein